MVREPGWDFHCVAFVAGHYKAVTGKSLWKVLGHRCPRSPREAASLYRRMGVTGLIEAVGTVLGAPIDPSEAMRGDIALVAPLGKGDMVPALGIVRGDQIECMDNMLPISRAKCCWKLSPFRAD